ncbi:MAG: undecaprenyldiphospho-muramoylpentapeptide beta-N-acetylglucosaminyltransferase [Limnochordales bacterium]|nr:undecaprenyldiphospho-muramoylpentapeptide beta-N-acetylglucosaminyltransferase [Limnochordales bacterium]
MAGSDKLRVVVTGGGTGGHVYPALTLARALVEQEADVIYVGTDSGLEARLAPREGLTFHSISARPLKRSRPWTVAGTALAAGVGVLQAVRMLARFRPDLVIATGGYVCGPLALAAALRRIPLLVQEQNALPGRTSRYLARYARVVALGFAEAIPYFPAACRPRLVVTGNPVRPAVIQAERKAGLSFFRLDERRRTLLVAGGSQGAQRLNQAVREALPWLLDRPDLQVIWLTGERSYPQIVAQLPGEWRQEKLDADGYEQQLVRQRHVLIAPYTHAMALALAAADLAVSRAGALSLAELLVQKVPAVLVPYPFAADNHQQANAEVLARQGAAVIVPDAELSGERLVCELQRLLDDAGRLAAMRARAAALAKPQATEEILSLARRIIGNQSARE